MGCMSIVMVPPQTEAGALVEGKTQGVVRGLAEDYPGQGCLSLKGCPLKSHSPSH